MATKSKKGVGSKKTANKKKGPVALVAKTKGKAKKKSVAVKPINTAKPVKPMAESKPQSKAKPEPKPEVKPEVKPVSKPVSKPETKVDAKLEAKLEAKPEIKKPVVLPEPAKGQVMTEGEKKWRECIEKVKGTVPVAYNMSGQFSVKAVIEHKVLGLGYVNSILNDRLEVIFKDGVRTLISNWKKS